MTHQLSLCGEEIVLLPERALLWPRRQTLILSDVHWGKAGHFRKNGIAIPGGVQDADGLRLSLIIQRHKVARLIIAGDLFHSHHNREVEQFGHWRSQHPDLEIDFILGNHDILARHHYTKWHLNIFPESLALDPFFITHDEHEDEGCFTIHGHVHPGIRIPGAVRQTTLPCFAINPHCMILPAFGQFTGFKKLKTADYQQLFVVGDGEVLQLK